VAAANLGAGWLGVYLKHLFDGGVVGLEAAKELVEESGDLRQMQVDKGPAKLLFAALYSPAYK
jgi:hypothetical protein